MGQESLGGQLTVTTVMASSEIVPYNDEYNFGNLICDVLGESQVLEDVKKAKTKPESGQQDGGDPAYLFLDFRRGKDDWPEGVEVCAIRTHTCSVSLSLSASFSRLSLSLSHTHTRARARISCMPR